MKPSELRVGNWAQSDGALFQIEAHHLIDIEKSCTEPIILNEEWLLKFGFEKNDGNIGLKPEFQKENNWYYHLADFGTYHPSVNQMDISNYEVGFFISCQFVHQLQNLYFALTQQELTIQL